MYKNVISFYFNTIASMVILAVPVFLTSLVVPKTMSLSGSRCCSMIFMASVKSENSILSSISNQATADLTATSDEKSFCMACLVAFWIHLAH